MEKIKTAEEFKELIRSKVKEVWIGKRSIDPITEQTNLLFDALYPFYSSQFRQRPTAKVKHPINGNCKINKEATYCYHCGTSIRHQKYCHGCGYRLIWDAKWACDEIIKRNR